MSVPRAVPGELLVRFRASGSRRARAAALERAGADVVHEYRTIAGLARVKARATSSAAAALTALTEDGEVLYAEPNYVLRAFVTPDDPGYPEQWGLHNTGQSGGTAGADIHAPEAWDLTTGGGDAVLAVLDSGVDTTHPDLAANLWTNPGDCDADGLDDDDSGFADDCHGVNVLAGTGDPTDDYGHGTQVAGIIGARGNDASGIAGVSWVASIVSCKWLDASGEGATSDAIACLDYVARLKDGGVNVVATNNSWGGWFPSRALDDAIEAQLQRGILFVTAAGNEGGNVDDYLIRPCSSSHSNVICVGASTSRDSTASFSNSGRHTVHLLAPGEGMLSTYPMSMGGYAVGDGTSLAAPHVTGTIGLYHALHPGADWRTVRSRILASGAPLSTGPYSRRTITDRRLDAFAALTCTSGTAVTTRLEPFDAGLNWYHWASLGEPLKLAALNVDCTGPRGDVLVAISHESDPLATVTLRDDGTGGDAIAGDGVSTATWIPPSAGVYSIVFPGDEPLLVNVDPHLEAGFPAKMLFLGGTYHGGPALNSLVGDIDGNPGLEIVVSAVAAGPVYAFRADGSLAPGWPVLDGNGVGYSSLAKLSATHPGEQIVTAYFHGGVSAYSGSGELLPGWPTLNGWSDPHPLNGPPAAADVDGDGLDEVFAVKALRADGTFLNAYGVPRGGWAATGVVDRTGAGDLVIVSSEQGDTGGVTTVFARPDGTPVQGFPIEINGHFSAYPAFGDVDGDRQVEMVVASGNGVAIYDMEGSLENEIPVLGFPGYGYAPALADLDGDGVLDIVYQTDTAMGVVRGDGSSLPGWPVTTGASTWGEATAPVVGDVTGDGFPDVVATWKTAGQSQYGRLYVYDRDGQLVPGFPKLLEPFSAGVSPAIADIDLDGRNEIIATGDPWNGWSGQYDSVYVFDLGGPPHGPVLWGQFMGGPHHTGNTQRVAAPARAFHRVDVSRSGNGVVTSSPFGIDCGATCSRSFPASTIVTLRAAPSAGHQVTWNGPCTGSAEQCIFVLDSDQEVGAAFSLRPYTVSVSRTGSSSGTITSSPAGIDCGTVCSASFDYGTIVTLSATPEPGAAFGGWQAGDCFGASPTCLLSVSEARTATARFDVLRSRITVHRLGAGTGTVTSTPAIIACGQICTALFANGTTVTLEASPARGSSFVGWSGPCAGAGRCVVSADTDQDVTATFELATGGGGGGCSTGDAIPAGGLVAVVLLLRLGRVAQAGVARPRSRRECASSRASGNPTRADGPAVHHR